MSALQIGVTGPESTALAVAGLLGSRWAGQDREVVVLPESERAEDTVLRFRPGHERVHDALGISLMELRSNAGAQPTFAQSVAAFDGPVRLPFSDFGLAHAGIDFHHYWHRGAAFSAIPALEEFSLALALDQRHGAIGFEQLTNLPLRVGMQVDRQKYVAILRDRLVSAPIVVASPSDASDFDGDALFHCAPTAGSHGFLGSEVYPAASEGLHEYQWELACNAALRFISLSASIESGSPERTEFNRLAALEQERLEDMNDLLSGANPMATERAALQRKLRVFEACGRIPMEDFEVFRQSEWLAALWERGVRPRRAHRLAELMPKAELSQWLAALRTQVQQLAGAGGLA